MEPEPDRALEIDADHRQQRREWATQRVAKVGLLALLTAIGLGLFGRGGPISAVAKASGDGAARLEYQRFARHNSPDRLDISARARSTTLRVSIDSAYLKQVQLDHITPMPERAVSADGAVVYVFHTAPAARINVTFDFSPEYVGRLRGWIAVDDQDRFSIDQFVYP
jgi:hypothetical protein